jgi:hypothetical protein
VAIEGKIALVTGASSGIGEATAKRLAKAGYMVYGTSRRGVHADKRPFEMLPLDVTSDESVEAAVSEVMRLEGRIDLLDSPSQPGIPKKQSLRASRRCTALADTLVMQANRRPSRGCSRTSSETSGRRGLSCITSMAAFPAFSARALSKLTRSWCSKRGVQRVSGRSTGSSSHARKQTRR